MQVVCIGSAGAVHFPALRLGKLTAGGSMRYLPHIPEMQNSIAQRTLESAAAAEPEVMMLGAVAGEPILTIERT